MSEFKLIGEIIQLSNSDNWDEAKLEWGLHDIYRAEEADTCLCGHHPIIEICEIRNKFNGEIAIVGNVCVDKFIGLHSDAIFQSARRIKKDIAKSLGAEAISHAYDKKWLTKWEKKFCFDTMRKRKLSPKQEEKRIQINKKFIQKMNKK